ncbi:SAM-dependent methyltransferase [Thermodesulfobacteriota bacterium]
MVLKCNFKLKRRFFISILGLVILTITSSFFISSAVAQYSGSKFSQQSGIGLSEDSKGLDVAYVPTPIFVVTEMLKLSSLGPNDFLIDLGSGDGRIIITAAQKFGALGFGVDLNPKLVELSKQYAIEEEVADRTTFRIQNIFETDLRKADVVTMYLLPELNLKLRPKLISDLKPGARIVSHNYHLGEWRPDKTVLFKQATEDGDSIIYLWIVPANVVGTWQWRMSLRSEEQDFNLRLNQNFQDLSGSAMIQGRKWPVFNTSLKGDRISFSLISEGQIRLIRQDYTGRIKGNVITGTVKLSGATEAKQMKWKALRKEQQ